ncbi:hypothetical protein LCGC14_1035040 [marine sediment metagenome]|uniref:Uncharacterized protein n=1 Tax=marine sediment metagenome TaxID=412755 RepID=A0A0F9NF30_9ZZZZ
MTPDQKTINALKRDFAKVGEMLNSLQKQVKAEEARTAVAREEAEHAEEELAEYMATNEKAADDQEWLLEAVKNARLAAGHSPYCLTVMHPRQDDFCDCGCGSDWP